MKRLTNFKNFTLALVFTAISVISWGQTECTSLNDCVIKGVSDYYNLDDNNPISVTFTVLWANFEEYTLIAGADKHYTYSFFDKDGNSVNNPIANEGFYRLIITGTEVVDENDACYTGTITKDFYVIKPSDHTLEETGEQSNPYIINDESDWWALATHPEYQASNKFVKLNQNLTLGAISGENITKSGLMIESFKGHFDGDGHTLTFYYTGQGEEDVPVAPFQYTDNASFSNLIVNGEIKKYVYGSAGLIGHNTGATKVEEVIVGLNINCGNWDGKSTIWSHRCGGFAVDGSGAEFKKCIYNGEIQTVIEDRNGGFCGKGSAKTSFTNCLFYPNLEESKLNGVIFANGGDDYPTGKDAVIGTVNNSYYTFDSIHQVQYGQGTFAYASVAKITNGVLAQKKTMTNNVSSYNIYEPVTVTIDEDIYTYTGSDITPEYSVYFNGVEKTLGTDYTAVIKNSSNQTVTVLHDEGNYTLVITGVNGADYYGYTEKVLMVIPADATWESLQGIINNDVTGEITLDKDYYARSSDHQAITISKSITIKLNNHKIDRHLLEAVEDGRVIRIIKNNSSDVVNVTIEGPGTITGGYNVAKDGNTNPKTNDGGGIYNEGNLTLNKVNVSGNHCVKKDENSTSATGRGGGIYSGQNSTLHIYGCVIRDNSAQGGAGGVFADRATSFIVGDYSDSKATVHTSIRSNTSKDKGGGLRVKGTAELNNCEISANEVNNGTNASVANGGGIHLDDGTLTLNNCTINNNTASKYGGGVYAIAGTINANGCEINYNKSYDEANLFEGRGGAVFMYGGTFKMNGGTIYNNSSNKAYGGGVYINSGAKFELKGNASINGNWDNDDKSSTNVYLVGSSIIKITGSISSGDGTIGVAKSGGVGTFTNGLNSNSVSSAVFFSDNSEYQVQKIDNEAKLVVLTPWTPNSGSNVVNEPKIINSVVPGSSYSILFGPNGSITIVEGGYLNADIVNTDPTKLIINGGELVTNNSDVKATIKKDIVGALPLSSKYWYMISSAINDPDITEQTNLIKLNGNSYPEYDLYRFNEAVDLQWENYRSDGSGSPAHPDFTTLQNGRGYLYRNLDDYTITISGVLNTGTITTPTLSCTAIVSGDDNIFKGFNIIGNPYSHNIKKGAAGNAIVNGDLLEDNYYRLLEDGTWSLGYDNVDIIPPFEGIMVQATTSSALTINNVAVDPSSKGEIVRGAANDNIWFTINNGQFEDCACVQFKKGHGLNKIPHQNENAPMLYINYNGEDFASVDMSKDVKSINLNFDAKTTGYYTLSMKSDGEFDYIHLIDRLTGDDIDMLQEEEYTFIGSASDNADRFLVKLSPSTGSGTGSEAFAWQNGNDIIVNGNGELQVFDVMGRMVATRHINGVQTINLTQTGVYIFRLEGKTQKIIVR